MMRNRRRSKRKRKNNSKKPNNHNNSHNYKRIQKCLCPCSFICHLAAGGNSGTVFKRKTIVSAAGSGKRTLKIANGPASYPPLAG